MRCGWLWLPTLAVLGALLAGCPPPVVIIGGKEVPRAEAPKLAFDAAQKDAEAGKAEEAAAKFRDFLKEYPDSNLVDAALAALGDLALKAGRLDEAAGQFRRLVSEFPQSPHYLNAAIQLGLVLVKLGRTDEALPTLQSVFDQLPDTRKKTEVAGMLARSYASAGAPVVALRWYAVLFDLVGEGTERTSIREQVQDLIDRGMSFTQVREALEVLKDAKVKGFPVDLLQFKLAKIFYHIHDFANARSALESFAAAYPGHEFSGAAGKLLKRIIDRERVNPNTIGVLLPLTGEYREYGQKALEGLQLGAGILEDSAKAGQGPVLVIRDTAGKADQAAAQMEDLVFNEHVIAVVGPMFSQEAYAAAVKAEELEVPIVTLCGREEITKLGSYVFRNFLTLSAQARVLVRYAMEKLGVKRFALLYPNDWYGVAFANAFWDEVTLRHGEVRAAERYEPDEKNFSDPVKKLVGRYYLEARWDFAEEWRKARQDAKTPLARHRAYEKLIKRLSPVVDFEALFVPDIADTLALIAPAIAYEDIVLWTDNHWQIERIKKSLKRDKLDMVYLLGGDGWDSKKVVEWAGRYVQGAIFTDGFFPSSSRPATQLFLGKFKASFDREPTLVEAEAYDTGKIVENLVSKDKPADRRGFREALLRVKGFDGATGTTTFGPDREAEKNLFLLTIKKEDILELDAESPPNAGRG